MNLQCPSITAILGFVDQSPKRETTGHIGQASIIKVKMSLFEFAEMISSRKGEYVRSSTDQSKYNDLCVKSRLKSIIESLPISIDLAETKQNGKKTLTLSIRKN